MTSKPKKPLNPWFLFLQENKTEFIARAGGKYRLGISMAADAFIELPKNNIYVEKAKELKEVYKKEKQAFIDAGGETAKAAKKAAKAAKKDEQPKRPKNPYFIFWMRK